MDGVYDAIFNDGVKLNVRVDIDPVGAAWLAGAIFVGILLALLVALLIYGKI